MIPYTFAEKDTISDQQILEALALWADLLVAEAKLKQKEEAVAKLPPAQEDTPLTH